MGTGGGLILCYDYFGYILTILVRKLNSVNNFHPKSTKIISLDFLTVKEFTLIIKYISGQYLYLLVFMMVFTSSLDSGISSPSMGCI